MQGKKFIPTDEQLKEIEELYKSPDISQVEIAEKFGVSPSTLSRIAKEHNIVKVRQSVWTTEKVSWLKENYDLPYTKLVEHLGFDNETIRLKINELGIKRNTNHKPYKLDITDQEFLSDLRNPRLTAPDIVEKYKDKYGIGESRIHQLRKQERIKLQVNTLERESSAEKFVREVLEDLDVAYVKEKRIGRYSIDFYLGFHICIEVQGTYWHKKLKRRISDNKKRKYLESLGYKVFYIKESELEQSRNIILELLQNLGFPIQ